MIELGKELAHHVNLCVLQAPTVLMCLGCPATFPLFYFAETTETRGSLELLI
jgi:hypothetical protein